MTFYGKYIYNGATFGAEFLTNVSIILATDTMLMSIFVVSYQ